MLTSPELSFSTLASAAHCLASEFEAVDTLEEVTVGTLIEALLLEHERGAAASWDIELAYRARARRLADVALQHVSDREWTADLTDLRDRVLATDYPHTVNRRLLANLLTVIAASEGAR